MANMVGAACMGVMAFATRCLLLVCRIASVLTRATAYTHGGLDRIMRESPRQQQRQGAPIR